MCVCVCVCVCARVCVCVCVCVCMCVCQTKYQSDALGGSCKLDWSCTCRQLLIYRHHMHVTCPHQMRHCSWSLCPNGLDCANHINLSLCLHLLNQQPHGYECTSATQAITGEGHGKKHNTVGGYSDRVIEHYK